MKIFIFLVGIGWDWGILGSNNLMNWWDINPPFMYCVFHHISDHLQRFILFWQFYKKVGIRSDPPPPGWDKIPSLSKELFVGLPLHCIVKKNGTIPNFANEKEPKGNLLSRGKNPNTVILTSLMSLLCKWSWYETMLTGWCEDDLLCLTCVPSL